MQRKTDTIEVGSQAPEFSLSAANRQNNFSLQELIGRWPLVVEFLRGTW